MKKTKTSVLRHVKRHLPFTKTAHNYCFIHLNAIGSFFLEFNVKTCGVIQNWHKRCQTELPHQVMHC